MKLSNSSYNSLEWVIPKKPDAQRNKTWRMMIDVKRKNNKRHVSSFQYYGNIGSARKCKIF